MVQVDSEVPRPIQEFQVKNRAGFESELVGLLKEPTRKIADLHLVVGTDLWYRRVFKGKFGDETDLSQFKQELQKRASFNPELLDPYHAINYKWEAVPISSISVVRSLLDLVSLDIDRVVDFIEINGVDSADVAFGTYLRSQATAFRSGNFDALMVNWLRRPADYPIGWFGGPVEFYHDPLKRKAAFQGLLTTSEPVITRAANLELAKFKQASQRRYSEVPIDATVDAAYTNMLSGWLGERGRFISAENVPNDPKLAERAGRHRIMLFMGRMKEKLESRLSPTMQKYLDIKPKLYNVIDYVEGHEYAHGYRIEGESGHWGDMRSVGRELWAADRAVVLASEDPFSDSSLRRVIVGMLAYALDDASQYIDLAFSPVGTKLPSLEDLRASEAGDYAPGGITIIRAAYLNGYIGRRKLNFKGIVELAAERDRELENIARSGDENGAKKLFREYIQPSKYYPLDKSALNENKNLLVSSIPA